MTGGWAAGLRLALLAMEGTDDPRGVLGSFNGAQPLVEGYLTEELERSLGSDLFDVLIRTGVTDGINAPLAIALTGDAGLSAQLWTRLGGPPGRPAHRLRLVPVPPVAAADAAFAAGTRRPRPAGRPALPGRRLVRTPKATR